MKFHFSVIRALLVLCVVLQLAFFVLAWSGWLPPTFFMQMNARAMTSEAMRGLVGSQRAAGAIVALPALLALCYGLWRLSRALVQVERGAMFALTTIGHLRAFAAATLVSTVCAILEVPARALVFRLALGAPVERIGIGVSSDQLLLMLVCAIFTLVIHMLHEARRLALENEGFV